MIRDRRGAFGPKLRALMQRVWVNRHWPTDEHKGKPGAETGLAVRALRVAGIALKAHPRCAQREPADATVNLRIMIEAARMPHRCGFDRRTGWPPQSSWNPDDFRFSCAIPAY